MPSTPLGSTPGGSLHALAHALAHKSIPDTNQRIASEYGTLAGVRRIAALALVLSSCTEVGEIPRPARDTGAFDTAAPPAPSDAWFRDVALEAGVLHRRSRAEYTTAAHRFGGGVCVFDVDGDGHLDLFFPGYASPRSSGPHLYLARGRLKYLDETDSRGLGDVGDALGCLAFDVDGDGDLDLLVTAVGGPRLYRNDGGRFVNVSDRLGTPMAADVLATSAVAFDADDDGDLDLMVGAFGRYVPSDAPCYGPCEANILHYEFGGTVLLLQRDDGTFEDATERIGRPREPTLALLATDLDADGKLDIFVGNDLAAFRDRYLRRRADGKFEDIAEKVGVAVTSKSGSGISTMSAFDVDIDGDGALDLSESSNEVEPNPMFRCSGGRCVDVAEELELFRGPRNFRWGQALVDFDHDGVVEMFEAVGHWEIENANEGISRELETYARPVLWRHARHGEPLALMPAKYGLDVATGGRGVIAADLDGDGDLDVVVAAALGKPLVLENVRIGKGSALHLALAGRGKNRFGVGAHVRVHVGARTIPFIAHAGVGYMSSGDPRIHVGVGSATSVTVDVDWPSGKKSVAIPLPATGTQTITEP